MYIIVMYVTIRIIPVSFIPYLFPIAERCVSAMAKVSQVGQWQASKAVRKLQGQARKQTVR